MGGPEMELERYESVEKWLRDVAFERSGSLNTKENYLKVLGLFCRFVGKSPDEMVSECASGDVDGYLERLTSPTSILLHFRSTIRLSSLALVSRTRAVSSQVSVGLYLFLHMNV